MIISRTSWHYRFLMKFGNVDHRLDLKTGKKPYTTCSYIRAVLCAMFSVFAFGVSAIAAIGFVSVMLYGMIRIAALTITNGMLPPEPSIAIMIGFVGWLLAFTATVIVLANLLIKGIAAIGRKIAKSNSKRKNAKQPSLFKAALQDRKDGICTIVTFE